MSITVPKDASGAATGKQWQVEFDPTNADIAAQLVGTTLSPDCTTGTGVATPDPTMTPNSAPLGGQFTLSYGGAQVVVPATASPGSLADLLNAGIPAFAGGAASVTTLSGSARTGFTYTITLDPVLVPRALDAPAVDPRGLTGENATVTASATAVFDKAALFRRVTC